MLDIKIQQLAIGKQLLIQNLDLQVAAGCIHTLMGPSGCGKSSLLAAIANCLSPDFDLQCQMFLNQANLNGLSTQERKIGMLFQEPLLFPHLSVLENLLFAIPKKYSKAQKIQLANQALIDAQLSGMGPQDPNLLSGGQKARVALLRALLAEPQALLLDEPFSKLDESLRYNIRQFVFETVRKRAIPVLIVTHDVADIADHQHLTVLNG
jgi:putative thiamine transport system ATP-binding protein